MDSCPWYDINYSQERYIVNLYGHYRNGHLMIPLADWPGWLSDAIAILTHVDNVEQENRMNRSKA